MFIFLISAIALNQRINQLSTCPSPSDTVNSPGKLLTVFGDEKLHIYIGRPHGAPALIFSPAFAKLQQRLDDLESVHVSRHEVVEHAKKYLDATVKFHSTEKDREERAKDIIDEAIGEGGEWQCPIDLGGTTITPGACWWHKEFLIQVLGLRNTLGLSGDALYQTVIAYSKTVSLEKVQCALSAPQTVCLSLFAV